MNEEFVQFAQYLTLGFVIFCIAVLNYFAWKSRRAQAKQRQIEEVNESLKILKTIEKQTRKEKNK